jgi:hypothetical protein
VTGPEEPTNEGTPLPPPEPSLVRGRDGVSPDQFVVLPGRLDPEDALEALAEFLVDLWLARRERKRLAMTPPPRYESQAGEAG